MMRHNSSSTMGQESSPHRSPLRSPRRALALKGKPELINEVRDSLSMPVAPSLVDEDHCSRTYESVQIVTVATSSAQVQQQTKAVNSPRRQLSSASSNGSRKSKRWGKLQKQPGDSATVASTKSAKSWLSRSMRVPRKLPAKAQSKRFKSFRVAKKKKKQNNNDQLVADFFDVQSVASTPELGGRGNKQKSKRHLETHSVASHRSTRSFRSIFKLMKWNDEVADIEDDSSVAVNSIYEQDAHSINDEDITLGSGFDNLSQADDVSVVSMYSYNSRSSRSSMPESPQQKKPKSFIQRLLSRNSNKEHKTVRQHVNRHPSATEKSDSENEEPIHRGVSLMHGQMSTKSLGAVPTRTVDVDDFYKPESISEQSPHGPPSGGDRDLLCRWDSDHSIASNPTAPKLPKRRTDPSDVMKSSTTKTEKPKKYRSVPQTSQSMRNLTTEDSKDSDDDDDSVLSLLSGLLATWSAEREGMKDSSERIAEVSERSCSNDELRPKSILKSISSEQRCYSVSFDRIEIREYERIVGDNPSCSRGPPISIGWAYQLSRLYPVEDYETLMKPARRSKKEFHLAADKRTEILVDEWKCSDEDIRKARREATYIQYCRAKTSFSGSRAAAKEAAFLRKANDHSKQMLLSTKVTTLASSDSPKPVARRNSNPEPEPVTPIRQHIVAAPAATSPSSSARHLPLLEV